MVKISCTIVRVDLCLEGKSIFQGKVSSWDDLSENQIVASSTCTIACFGTLYYVIGALDVVSHWSDIAPLRLTMSPQLNVLQTEQ